MYININIYTYTYICVYIYIYTHTYIRCPGRTMPYCGRMFLKLKYPNITQNDYIQS